MADAPLDPALDKAEEELGSIAEASPAAVQEEAPEPAEATAETEDEDAEPEVEEEFDEEADQSEPAEPARGKSPAQAPAKPQAESETPAPALVAAPRTYEQQFVDAKVPVPPKDAQGNLLIADPSRENALRPVNPVTGMWVVTEADYEAMLFNGTDDDGNLIPPSGQQIIAYNRFQSEYRAEEQRRMGAFRQSVKEAANSERAAKKAAVQAARLPKDSRARAILDDITAKADAAYDAEPDEKRFTGMYNVAFGHFLAEQLTELLEAVQSGAVATTEKKVTAAKRVIATSAGRAPATSSAAVAQEVERVPARIKHDGHWIDVDTIARENGMSRAEWLKEYKSRLKG